jgi:hypothetical protein
MFKSGVALNATAQSLATPSQGTGGVFGGSKLAVICGRDLESLHRGGKIRSGVKMCIKEKGCCSISSHATKAGFAPQLESTSGEYVVIGVGIQMEQVYLSHIVPVESFKADLKIYLFETRTMDEWNQFFSTIKAGTLDREEIGLAASKATVVARERATTGGSVSTRKGTAGGNDASAIRIRVQHLRKFCGYTHD